MARGDQLGRQWKIIQVLISSFTTRLTCDILLLFYPYMVHENALWEG
ncbi:MAG: hypothetical protein MUP08_09190 [Desulfobulbaceae bacterium]|nr:hypothetical protein [Desulfobulbaceae bacterium]